MKLLLKRLYAPLSSGRQQAGNFTLRSAHMYGEVVNEQADVGARKALQQRVARLGKNKKERISRIPTSSKNRRQRVELVGVDAVALQASRKLKDSSMSTSMVTGKPSRKPAYHISSSFTNSKALTRSISTAPEL